jgi:hypothetical protein
VLTVDIEQRININKSRVSEAQSAERARKAWVDARVSFEETGPLVGSGPGTKLGLICKFAITGLEKC